MSGLFQLKVTCHNDIFRNIDRAVARDMVRTIEGFSDTAMAKMRTLMDQCDDQALGKFLREEYNHFRSER